MNPVSSDSRRSCPRSSVHSDWSVNRHALAHLARRALVAPSEATRALAAYVLLVRVVGAR